MNSLTQSRKIMSHAIELCPAQSHKRGGNKRLWIVLFPPVAHVDEEAYLPTSPESAHKLSLQMAIAVAEGVTKDFLLKQPAPDSFCGLGTISCQIR